MLSYDITVKRYILNDKNLKGAEKLFFVQLLGLISHLGYCWATNEYLAAAAGVKARQVQRYLEKLKKINYIKVIIIRDEKNRVAQRRIYTRQTFSERSEVKRVYEGNAFFQKEFPHVMDDVTPHVMDDVYIEHNSTYKKKVVKEESVRETKPQVQSRPSALDPPFSKKIKEKKIDLGLTDEERKRLEAKMGVAELKKFEAKRDAHLKKCPKSLHHGKRAIETITQFYNQEQEERLRREKSRNENKSQVSITRAEKGRKLVRELLEKNPLLNKYFIEARGFAQIGRTDGVSTECVGYDDPELYNKIEDMLNKIRKYDGIDCKMPLRGEEYLR